jgi:ferredoxin
MAKLVNVENGKEVELEDGSRVKDACKKIGIPFGCEDGQCGTCAVEIVEGVENLEGLNQKEEDMGMDEKWRLCCQCTIKKGVVKVRP